MAGTSDSQFAVSNSDIAIICSSDDDYEPIGVEITEKLKTQNSKLKVIIAGNPVSSIDTLKNTGVDDFIHMKSSILDVLEDYQKHFNIIS